MGDPLFTNDRSATSRLAWWLLIVLGLLGIGAGVVVLAKPGDSLAALAVITGIFLVADGILEIGASLFEHPNMSRGLLGVLGALSVILGIVLVRHPVHTVTAIAILLGIWLVVVGIIRFVAAWDRDHRGMRIAVALVEVVAGTVIVSSPDIGYATLALLVGISFILNGIGLFAIGWTMHGIQGRPADVPVDHSPAESV